MKAIENLISKTKLDYKALSFVRNKPSDNLNKTYKDFDKVPRWRRVTIKFKRIYRVYFAKNIALKCCDLIVKSFCQYLQHLIQIFFRISQDIVGIKLRFMSWSPCKWIQVSTFDLFWLSYWNLTTISLQASATAQAALAGKQILLQGLEQQFRDAQQSLMGEKQQLMSVCNPI